MSRAARIARAERDVRAALAELAERAALAARAPARAGRRPDRGTARRRARARAGPRSRWWRSVSASPRRASRRGPPAGRSSGSAGGAVGERGERSAARSASTRSRMASATSSLLIRGSSSAPPQRSSSDDLVVVGVEADALRGSRRWPRGGRRPWPRSLAARVGAHVVGLGREADQEARGPCGAASSLRMSGLGASSSVSPSSLLRLDLGRARLLDAVVGHRRRLDHDGGALEVLERGLAHLLRGLHRHVHRARRAA